VDRKNIISQMGSKFHKIVDNTCEDVLVATNGVKGSKVRGCPDSIRNGFKLFKYVSWFKNETEIPTIFSLQDAYDIRMFAKFRCGMHWLATEKDRRGVGGKVLDRSSRVCRICGGNDREDEVHIFMCGGYKLLHQQFTHIFETDQYRNLKTAYDNNELTDDIIKNFMNQNDRMFVVECAGFLRKSFAMRKRILDSRTT
jgi:hypothetical protein